MKPLYTTIRFKCPKCGSTMFGASGCNERGERMTYHCHANERGRCSFTCPQGDFWKYQEHHVVTQFETKAEYDAAYQAQTRPAIARGTPL